jgi:hypothetical protein
VAQTSHFWTTSPSSSFCTTATPSLFTYHYRYLVPPWAGQPRDSPGLWSLSRVPGTATVPGLPPEVLWSGSESCAFVARNEKLVSTWGWRELGYMTDDLRAARRSGRPEGGYFGHCEPPGSRVDLRPVGGGPGGPTWSQGHLVRWWATPTGASTSSFASSPYKWLAPGR